jgi:hypothetical protein
VAGAMVKTARAPRSVAANLSVDVIIRVPLGSWFQAAGKR